MDFKFCLLAGGRPPSCSDRLIIYSHMRTRDDGGRCLSESHSFQANTSDDGGRHDREKMPVTQSSRIRIFKLKLLSAFTIKNSNSLHSDRQ